LGRRTEIIENYLKIISDNKNQLAEIITMENGKTIKESFAELNSGLNEAYYQLTYLREFLNFKKAKLETRYYPLGTVLLITPWNFPFATIMRKLIPAIMIGNSAILKPSEYTPLTSAFLFDLLSKAEFPPGTLNLVLGDGRIAALLTRHPKISAISLTGSVGTGKSIKKNIAERMTRFQAEMGGKNTVAVLPDADLTLAAQDIVSNSYACSGQWCTGTSRVIVHKDVSAKLTENIIYLAEQIKIGDGAEESTDMGPLISDIQLAKVQAAVAANDSAQLLLGGKRPDPREQYNGYFFEPTVFTEVNPVSQLSQEEIFGPVLSIIEVVSMQEMMKIINNSKYGLSFSVYTKDENSGEDFIEKAENGLCHINLPTANRDPSLPLSGWKDSGFGQPEAGPNAFSFFSRTKAIYRNI
jgi:aldehyde dehydrogenase (NAD+)